MQTKITNLSDLHAQRRPAVTLDTLRLDARGTNRPQVIAHADDITRWLVITPGGAVMGTSAHFSAIDAEMLAEGLADRHEWGAPCVRMDEVGK